MKEENARKTTGKKSIILIGAAIVIIVAAVFLIYSQGITGSTTKKYGNIEEALRQLKAGAGDIPKERPDYLPAEVYQNLPEFPEDFYYIDIMIESGDYPDISLVGEEYYKQPELYPGWESTGVSVHQNPEPGRYGIWGWGAYPGDMGYEGSPGDELIATTFFHTSWGIQSYQGMRMNIVYPQNASIGGTPVNQNSEKTSAYFDVWAEPDVFLLGPTFPIFDSDWTKRVQIHIKIKPGTPKGIYVIGVNPAAPPKEYRDKWMLEHKLKYADAGATGVERPFFQVLVEVV